jgi:hypothetical protein
MDEFAAKLRGIVGVNGWWWLLLFGRVLVPQGDASFYGGGASFCDRKAKNGRLKATPTMGRR